MPEENTSFSLDDGEMAETLTTIKQTESGAPEGDNRASPPSGEPSASAAPSASNEPYKAPVGNEKAAMTAALGSDPTRQQVEAWRAMPTAWKKEMEAEWTTASDKVKQYVHEREGQAYEGIRQYKSVADKWTNTYTPYKQWFEHYKIDPLEAFNRLASSHIILKYGKPEDRATFARQMIKDYGLEQFLQQPQGEQGQQPQIPPQLAEELFQVKNELEGIKHRDQEKSLAEKKAQVLAFFSDPKNEFAVELKEDIQQLLEQGAATTLEQAYDKAKWLNPAVRERLMQRDIENATKPKLKGPSNIKPSSVPASPTDGADESLDDTLKATLGRINSR